jgi:hypothetical protein
MYLASIEESDIRQRKFAPLESFVPFFVTSGFLGLPTFTVKRYPPPAITGST